VQPLCPLRVERASQRLTHLLLHEDELVARALEHARAYQLIQCTKYDVGGFVRQIEKALCVCAAPPQTQQLCERGSRRTHFAQAQQQRFRSAGWHGFGDLRRQYPGARAVTHDSALEQVLRQLERQLGTACSYAQQPFAHALEIRDFTEQRRHQLRSLGAVERLQLQRGCQFRQLREDRGI